MSVPLPNAERRQLLAEALQLSRFLVGNADQTPLVQRRQQRLQEIQDDLQRYAHPVCRDRMPVTEIPLKVRRAFVQAALLITRYHQIGGMEWSGTIPSPTLSHYQPDPVPATWTQADAIAYLCRQFQLGERDCAQLERLLDQVDAQIQQQQRIMQAVCEDVNLQADSTAAEQQEGLTRLFRHLFGISLPASEINGVYTPLQVYFCLDVAKLAAPDAIAQLGLDHPDSTDDQRLQTLIQSLNTFSYRQFQKFPTFGPCDPVQMDGEWAERVAQKAKVSLPQLTRSLSRAVGIIPLHKAEAFLIHDIWGHHWQLMLTPFESDYAILADCDESLRAGETAYTTAGPLTCAELFHPTCNGVDVDRDRARLFFHGEVRQRLGLLFTHLIGEMVADAAEFKFVWDYPHQADQLLSSSLFKTSPTKLDLSLADLDFLFVRLLKPLLEVRLSALAASPLEVELLTRWAKRQDVELESLEFQTALKQAILQLYQIFLEEYNDHYLPTLTGDIGMFARIASNLLYLQNAVNTLYTDFTSCAHPDLPFQDLLIVFISRYCASDSYAEFWDVDDRLASYFLPCWLHLRQSQDAASPMTSSASSTSSSTIL
jgi:hypothetical protein